MSSLKLPEPIKVTKNITTQLDELLKILNDLVEE